ncbi:MAG: hypothetical protein ACTSVI_01935 [Promethearchaeota archaeon]
MSLKEKRKKVYLKLGGLLIDNKDTLVRVISGIKDITRRNHVEFFILVGGGHVVDDYRDYHKNDPGFLVKTWREFSGKDVNASTAAHWLAINEMRENMKKCSKLFQNEAYIHFIDIMEEIDKSKVVDGELPTSWDVTSDSLLYWCANQRTNKHEKILIVLLKNVDGVIKPRNVKLKKGLRRIASLQGELIPKLVIKDGIIQPKLNSYPFDSFIINLVEKFKKPFYVINYSHMDVLEKLIQNRFQDVFSSCSLICHESSRV